MKKLLRLLFKRRKKITVQEAYEQNREVSYKGRQIVSIEYHGFGYGPVDWFDANPPLHYMICFSDDIRDRKMLIETEKVTLEESTTTP